MNPSRRLLAGCFATVMAAAFAARAGAAVVSVSLTDHTSGLTNTTILQGGTFTLDVGLKTDTPFAGMSLFLNANTPSSGQFVAISRAVATWPQNGSTDSLTIPVTATIDSSNGGLLTSGNSKDFGYSSTNQNADIAASTSPGYAIESINFSTPSNLAPGTYTISSNGSSEMNTSFASGSQEITFPTTTFTVHINAVPEPASISLATAAATLLITRRRRQA